MLEFSSDFTSYGNLGKPKENNGLGKSTEQYILNKLPRFPGFRKPGARNILTSHGILFITSNGSVSDDA